MNAPIEAIVEIKTSETPFDLEAVFCSQYERVARVIAGVVRDPARAEELAVEVFLKLWRNQKAQGGKVEAWLHRVAVRTALDELRRETRRTRYEQLVEFVRGVPTPEDIHAASEEQGRVRRILSILPKRQAELLLLRSHGLTYEELAEALDRNPASVGTFLSRAQNAFRKEYVKRYGESESIVRG